MEEPISPYTWLLATALLLSLIWLLIYRRDDFRLIVLPAEADEPPPPSPRPRRSWRELVGHARETLRAHPEAMLALAVCLGLLAYTLLFLPKVPLASTGGQIGHPFNGLRFSRDVFTNYRDYWAAAFATIMGLASLALLAFAALARRRGWQTSGREGHAALLVAALGFVGVGQLGLLKFAPAPALHLIVGISGLFAWSLSYGRLLQADLLRQAWPRWLEISLLTLTVALTIFARFYGLSLIPYGLEGDESKWTVEVVESMFDGIYNSNTEFHLASVPISFYMQAPFHAALGPGMLAGRIAVAVYSVLGSIALYWLARQLFSAPVAWLATTLLAISPLDVSASRLANVESHVKLWPLLALALLAWSLRRSRIALYLLAGIALAIGLLTYDTVAPLGGVFLLLLGYELLRRRPGWPESFAILGATLAPAAIVTLITGPYLMGRFEYYGVVEQQWSLTSSLELFRINMGDLLSSLFISTYGDFLYNRVGPLFSAQLLPWLVLGVVVAVTHPYRRPLFWVGVVLFLFFIPVPVLAGTPFGRAFYAGLPAAYLLMSVAIVATFRELERALGPALKPLLTSLFALGLALLVGTNLWIYFNEVYDAPDRVIRRDLYEAGRAEGAEGTLMLFPYLPGANEPIEQERELVIRLGLRPRIAERAEPYPHQHVELFSLREVIPRAVPAYERVVVVWDPQAAGMITEREALLAEIRECYSGLVERRGRYFVRYIISAEQILASECR